MHKVTIGIPIFSVEKYIEKALLSALNQTFESIEYILVDGGGTDNSMNIVNTILKKHPRRECVRILSQKGNLGIGEDRNLIIRNSSTEFLYFLDSDDEMSPDCISILYSEIIKYSDVDFVNSQNKTIYTNTESIPTGTYKIYSCKKDIMNGYLSHNIAGVVWNKLYRTSFFKENQILAIHSMISEDVDFELQELFYARKIITIPNITYNYYRRGIQSTSLSSIPYSFLIKRSEVLIDLYPKFIIDKKMGKEGEIILVSHILLLLYDFSTLNVNKKEYFILIDKMYSKVLRYCHPKYFFSVSVHLSLRMRLCALIMLIPFKGIRHHYMLLLGNIGRIKRYLIQNKWQKF